MDKDERDRLVRSWIALQDFPQKSGQYDQLFWAHEKLWDLSQDQPDDCFAVILAILSYNTTDNILQNLAAGPLEDLLVANGAELIDQIELEASKNIAFRKLLGGVWQNAIPPAIWQRITAVSDSRW